MKLSVNFYNISNRNLAIKFDNLIKTIKQY